MSDYEGADMVSSQKLSDVINIFLKILLIKFNVTIFNENKMQYKTNSCNLTIFIEFFTFYFPIG